MEEYREVRQRTIQAVMETVKGPEAAVTEMAEQIADVVMDAIADNYRSITEVHSIVAAVRAGLNVQIAYADPDEDEFMNPYVVRPCW
jgi:hypothetical protein